MLAKILSTIVSVFILLFILLVFGFTWVVLSIGTVVSAACGVMYYKLSKLIDDLSLLSG
jgi:hypothetical protein